MALLALTAPLTLGGQPQPDGSEFQVNTHTSRDQRKPAVAMSPAGDFVVVWESRGQEPGTPNSYGGTYPDYGGIFGQRFASDGTPMGSEFHVNSFVTSKQSDASVSIGAAGQFVVVWQSRGQEPGTPSYYGGTYPDYGGIFGQRFDSDGTPLGPEFHVNTFSTDRQSYPSVSMSSAGRFVVVWESRGQEPGTTYSYYGSTYTIADRGGIFGQKFLSSGAPQGTEFHVNAFSTDRQEKPSVSMNSFGEFVVVWQSGGQEPGTSSGGGYSYPDYGGIFGQRFGLFGAPQGPEFHVNTFSANEQSDPSVAMSTGGEFVVAWQSRGQEPGLPNGYGGTYPDSGGIFGRRFASSGAFLGPEMNVNSFRKGRQDAPAVSVDSLGDFVVVWGSQGQEPGTPNGYGGTYPDYGGVFGQAHMASGVREGTEFHANTEIEKTQRAPAIASDALGNFVVVWESCAYASQGQDGDYCGIFAQRFCGPLGVSAPVDVEVMAGDGAMLEVQALGRNPFAYQWRHDGQALTDSGSVHGSDTATLTIDPAAVGDGGVYDCVVTDSCSTPGSVTSSGATLTVIPPPNTPPVASAGTGQSAKCTSPAGATVLLDGSGSTDPDSSAGTNDDIVLFEWFEDYDTPTPTLLGTGETLAAAFPVGGHDVTLRVTDSQGESDTDLTMVTVTDPDPPTITVTLSPSLLWPPNHQMVSVTAIVGASDACGDVDVALSPVASSEPDDAPGGGDGRTTGDIQGMSPGSADFELALRSERAGSGPGRTYTVTYTATDASGNVATASATARVPHDESGVTDPLVVDVHESALGTTIDWPAVPGALHYNVIRGEVRGIADAGAYTNLGPVTCVEGRSPDASTAGSEDAERPPPGSAFYYLVEYFDGLASTYGTETADKPRLPGTGACP